MKRKKKEFGAVTTIAGFYRVNIVDPETGEIKGDSGWRQNVISNLGLANYLAYGFASSGGSTGLSPKYMILGSLQSSHASNLVNATGAFNFASAASIATSSHATRGAQSDGHTVRFLATFVSGSLFTTTSTIASIALIHTTNATSAMCAGSFTASTLGSAQAVNCSYDIIFSATSTS
jgi:hypothetical protein